LSIDPVDPVAGAMPAGTAPPSVESMALQSFSRNARWIVFLLVAQASFVAIALCRFVPTWLLLGWFVLVLLHGFARERLRLRYVEDPVKDVPVWIRRLVMVSATNGALWGGFAFAVAPLLPANYRFLVLIVLVCLAAESGLSAVNVVPRIWMAFLLPLLVPTVGYMLLANESQRLAALAVVLAVLLLYRSLYQHYRLAREQVALKAGQQRLQTELDGERQRETELLRNKTLFLEAIGHDLFQLVHGMGLHVRELCRGGTVRTVAQELQRALDSLHRYLSTIRDTVRVDTGTYVCESFELPVQSILERVVAENLRMAEDAGLQLRYRKSSAWARTDPTLVHSIISNFVSNAIRYTRSGRIVLGVRRSGNELRVEVWDSGIGIRESELSNVFRDFYQVRRTRKTGAMGMGLPLVLRMARLLGVTVLVRSVPDKGSCFAISLPAGARRAAATNLLPPPQSFSRLFEQKSVLLLDADHSNLQRTGRWLRGWNLATRSLSLDEARVPGVIPPQNPVDVLIACLPSYREPETWPLLQALREQHRPKHTLLVLEQTLDPDGTARVRKEGLVVFYTPMPPWRLRVILWRLLASH
jgi:signal transduction histidine kinase